MFFVGACSVSLGKASSARGALWQRIVYMRAMLIIKFSRCMVTARQSPNFVQHDTCSSGRVRECNCLCPMIETVLLGLLDRRGCGG